ncbi:MAG: transporter [Oscillospiraceae bacterium]|nr:transporter [Oscillospiraceae bacterium]
MHLLKNRYVQLFSAFFFFSFVGVMSKMAALSGFGSVKFFVFIGLQIVLLGLYALIWQQVLKKFSLVTAMACRGSVVILSLVWAMVFFQEEITLFHLIGSLVIVLGIYVVATGEPKYE